MPVILVIVGLGCMTKKVGGIVFYKTSKFFYCCYYLQSINQLQKDIDEIQQQMEDNERMKMNLTQELLFTKGITGQNQAKMIAVPFILSELVPCD